MLSGKKKCQKLSKNLDNIINQIDVKQVLNGVLIKLNPFLHQILSRLFNQGRI